MSTDLFRLAYSPDPEPARTVAGLEADDSGDAVWPHWAAHLLGADDLGSLALVQDDDPDPPDGSPGPIDRIEAAWEDFVLIRELPAEQTGYAHVALGTLYGVPTVRFYDQGYSAFVFPRAAVSEYLDPAREEFARGPM